MSLFLMLGVMFECNEIVAIELLPWNGCNGSMLNRHELHGGRTVWYAWNNGNEW